MARPPVDVSVSTEGLDALSRALRQESDGKDLRKELAANMREALKPAAAEAKSAALSIPSGGSASSSSPALRPAIAKKIRPEVKLGGRWSGARIKARKTRNIRNFPNAPKRTQQASWRTRIFGSNTWREQRGKLDWFDDSMQGNAARYRDAVLDAMENMARRIANRSR